MIEKTSLICVGVQKSGTTTLHNILSQNPKLSLPLDKETHFFRDNEKHSLGLDWYSRQYKDNDALLRVEVDPEYSYFDYCSERIKSAFSDVKIVFIIRNPVERAFSHYMMTKKRGLENKSFLDALKIEQSRITNKHGKIHYSYIDRGYYLDQIKRFEKEFGAENVKVFLFEDLCKSPNKIVSELHDFIELKDFPYVTDLESNVQSASRFNWLSKFIWQTSRNGFFKIFLPTRKLRKLIGLTLEKMNTKPNYAGDRVVLERYDKKNIYEKYFKNEIENLEYHLNYDLSDWKYL